MKTRRHVLAVLGATAIAGCAGRATDQPAANTTADEPAAEGGTATDGVGDLHLDWAYGEDNEILEQVEDEVNLDPVKNILEGNQDIHTKIGDALLQANQQYTHNNEDYEHRHKYTITALDQALQQTDLDTRITSIADWAKTNEYGDGLDYGKIWINDSDKDINIALNPALREPAYHIEGEQPEGDVERILKEIRDQEYTGDLSAHNYETLEHSIEQYEATEGEFTDEYIEDWKASAVDDFGNYIWGDGLAVPSSVEDWKALHEGFESGAEIVRELNEAYDEAGYAETGETAQFTVEDGSVTMNDVKDGYNPSEDGVPGNPAA